jgi:hypothetical protein
MKCQKSLHEFQNSGSESEQARGPNPKLLTFIYFICYRFLSTYSPQVMNVVGKEILSILKSGYVLEMCILHFIQLFGLEYVY